MKRCLQAGYGLVLAFLLLTGCSNDKSQGNAPGATNVANGPEAAGSTGDTSSDAQLTKLVQEKIDADAALKTEGIHAKASGGQVDLTGTVKTTAEKDKAEQIANDAIKNFKSVNAGIVDQIEIAESSGSAAAGASSSPVSKK